MSGKIIVHNRTDMPMEEAMVYVLHVIRGGRVSETSKGKQYCFCTTWKDGIIVWATRNQHSDSFSVWKEKK